MSSARPDVVVVGAGVIGLTTAVCLAEAGVRVLVRTAEQPRQTTSAVAGALCGPTITGPGDPATGWGHIAEAEFTALSGQRETGIRLMRGRLVSKLGEAPPPWASTLPGYAQCSTQETPAGFPVAFWAQIPVADMPRYLDYLLDRLAAAGGRIELGAVSALAEAAAQAPVVVNCTGASARTLAADDHVQAVRGQHVIVENPGLDSFLHEGGAESAWTSFLPHSDRVVLGGIAVQNSWHRGPDAELTRQILTRCIDVEPRLADARILGVEVGLRPGRTTVRLEQEPLGGGRCIHNYGHGGLGVTLSWGCARDVLAIVIGDTDERVAHRVL